MLYNSYNTEMFGVLIQSFGTVWWCLLWLWGAVSPHASSVYAKLISCSFIFIVQTCERYQSSHLRASTVSELSVSISNPSDCCVSCTVATCRQLSDAFWPTECVESEPGGEKSHSDWLFKRSNLARVLQILCLRFSTSAICNFLSVIFILIKSGHISDSGVKKYCFIITTIYISPVPTCWLVVWRCRSS